MIVNAHLAYEDTANSEQNAKTRQQCDFCQKSWLLLLHLNLDLLLAGLQDLLEHGGRPLCACIALASALLIEQSPFWPLLH